MNQRALAERAGCSVRFVHMLETGKPSVRLDKAIDVLRALGLDLVVVGTGERRRGGIRGRSSPTPGAGCTRGG